MTPLPNPDFFPVDSVHDHSSTKTRASRSKRPRHWWKRPLRGGLPRLMRDQRTVAARKYRGHFEALVNQYHPSGAYLIELTAQVALMRTERDAIAQEQARQDRE